MQLNIKFCKILLTSSSASASAKFKSQIDRQTFLKSNCIVFKTSQNVQSAAKLFEHLR